MASLDELPASASHEIAQRRPNDAAIATADGQDLSEDVDVTDFRVETSAMCSLPRFRVSTPATPIAGGLGNLPFVWPSLLPPRLSALVSAIAGRMSMGNRVGG